MKKLILIPFVTIGAFSFAQERTVASGGDASSLSGKVSSSIGLIDYISASNSVSGHVSQGVQQPYELFPLDLNEVNANDIAITVYPNPFSDYLEIKSANLYNDQLKFDIVNSRGELVNSGSIDNDNFKIDLGNLKPTNYVISFYIDNKILKSYKLIKNK